MEEDRGSKSSNYFTEEWASVATRKGQGSMIDIEIDPRATILAMKFFF